MIGKNKKPPVLRASSDTLDIGGSNQKLGFELHEKLGAPMYSIATRMAKIPLC
jgi:hypothetical protein